MKFITTLRDIKKQKNYLRFFEDYIKNGIYIFDYKKNRFFRFSMRCLFKNIKTILYIVKIHSNKKINQLTSGVVRTGFMKLSLITDDYVISSFKKHPDLYSKSKKNILEYFAKLSYPTAKLISFDDEKKSYAFEFVGNAGSVTFDQETALLDYLITNQENVVETKKERFEDQTFIVSYAIQHGDARRENIIWQNNGDSFKFIDFDLVGVYPALFDFFYYVFHSCSNSNEIISSPSYLSLVRKRFGHTKYMDVYFSKFVSWFCNDYQNSNFNSKRDFLLLKKISSIDLSNFPFTKNVIKNIALHLKDNLK